MPARATTSLRDSSAWMVGAAFDLLIYSGITLYSACLVLGLGRAVDSRKLFYIFNIVFTLGHYAPTWVRAVADREVLRTRAVEIFGFPAAIIAFVYATRTSPEALAFILYFWDRYHALMQNFGFLRIYDARLGRTGGTWRILDRAFLFVSALWIASLNVALITPVYQRCALIGLPLPATANFIHALRWTFGIAALAIAMAYVVALWRAHKQDGKSGLPKIIYLLMLCAGHGLMNTTSDVFLLSCHEKLYHSIQYMAVSWRYERSRRARISRPRGFDALLAGKAGLPAYLAILLVWIAAGVGLQHALREGESLYTAGFGRLFGAFALMHYYFDSFLWKVRRPEVRANLELSPQP